MTLYLETSGDFIPWRGERIDGVLHPLSIETSWSSSDLEALDLFLPAQADPVPQGKAVTSTSVQRVGGVVKFVHDLTDLPPPSSDDVDTERDRRIAAGFVFGGVAYQSRPADRENIMGAATAALGAIVSGALPDDLRWHGGATDFVWIAADNSLTPMDAQTMFVFGQAAMSHKSAHIFAGAALKAMDPIPADYADDQWWP